MLPHVYFGLTAYAYGTSYFFLPIFVITLLIILVRNKQIKIKSAVISLAIVTVVSMPIILCVLINMFNLPEIQLPFMTIPRMVENRYTTETTLFSGNIIIDSVKNFVNSIWLLIIQHDVLPWNAIEPFGVIYLFSIPFTIIGIISEFKKKERYSAILKIWVIAALLMLFICEANINRCNIIMIPIIYYTTIGICEVIKEVNFVKILILSIYIISFIGFEITYHLTDFNQYYTFENEIEDTIEYIDNLDVETIYFSYSIKEPYIYVLFYAQEDPNIYIETVKYRDEKGIFENVLGFGKYRFYLPDKFENDGRSAYVIPINNELEINYDEWKTTYFERFIVLESKK